MMFSMVDADGNVVRSQYTDNPNAAVLDAHRLLKDQIPFFDSVKQQIKRMEPVPLNATEITYIVSDIPAENLLCINEFYIEQIQEEDI